MAAPTDRAVIDQALTYLGLGLDLRAACKASGLGRMAVRRWVTLDTIASLRCTRATQQAMGWHDWYRMRQEVTGPLAPLVERLERECGATKAELLKERMEERRTWR